MFIYLVSMKFFFFFRLNVTLRKRQYKHEQSMCLCVCYPDVTEFSVLRVPVSLVFTSAFCIFVIFFSIMCGGKVSHCLY